MIRKLFKQQETIPNDDFSKYIPLFILIFGIATWIVLILFVAHSFTLSNEVKKLQIMSPRTLTQLAGVMISFWISIAGTILSFISLIRGVTTTRFKVGFIMCLAFLLPSLAILMFGTRSDFRIHYLIISLIFSLAVTINVLRHRPLPKLFGSDYSDFILTRWRVVTFFVAAVPLIAIAPYTGDPTWDYFDAGFMAVLTFLTAPWAVGTIYRFLKKKESIRTLIFVFVCWMFTASWSYDLYILIKTGSYPETWAANILASSGLYASGGLFWSLRWKKGEGATFSFMHDNWPDREDDSQIIRILLWGLPFMVLFGAMLIYFLMNNHGI